MESETTTLTISRIYNTIPDCTLIGHNSNLILDFNQNLICNICGKRDDHGGNACPRSDSAK